MESDRNHILKTEIKKKNSGALLLTQTEVYPSVTL
jgi:hypothetical protein